MRTRTRLFTLAHCGAAVEACGGVTGADSPPGVAAVAVSPAAATLTSLEDTVRLAAEARDSSGTVLTGVTFAWQSSDASKVRVSAGGVATAVGPGSVSVTATAGRVSGSATVTVAQRVDTVIVTPSSPTLIGVGSTLQLDAEARDARGHAIAGTPFAWTSLDSSIASVSGTGLVTAVLAGSATITATAGEAVGSSSVRVRTAAFWFDVVWGSDQPARQHVQLENVMMVRAVDQYRVHLSGVPVTFAVPAGGSQMTCQRCWTCPGLAAPQVVTTDAGGVAILGDTLIGRYWGCTPHSAGRVVMEATSPGFEPAQFTFDVVAAGQPFDGFYTLYDAGIGSRSFFSVSNGGVAGLGCEAWGTVASDGAISVTRRCTMDCYHFMRGFVTLDSLGQATASGKYVSLCTGGYSDSIPWAGWRH